MLETLMGNTTISMTDYLMPIAASLVLGLVISLVHMYKNRSTGSFLGAIALLPAIVCVVIMAVNGNIGAGVAVAGAFSLVRFRSAPGTAREITAIFTAMATGLMAGMGYIAYAGIFVLVIGAATLVCRSVEIRSDRAADLRKNLRITIPEDLDYTGVFDDILDEYTKEHKLISSKTTNMGSMFKLTYEVTLDKNKSEKEFMDKLRCRNGNLEIAISSVKANEDQLL